MNAAIVLPKLKYRRTAVLVGTLFIIGTVSGVLSSVVITPIMTEGTFPNNIAANETRWIIGTLLVLMMGFPLAMIPVILYPVLKRHNEVLALGAVVFRGVLEAVCYLGTVLSNLLLLSLSQFLGKGGAADMSITSLASILLDAGDWISLVLGLVFSLGAMMIYFIFFRSRLVPRWLSAWGFIGAVLYFIAHLVSFFGTQLTLSVNSGLGILMIPLAIQEMIFAIWLIVKGFDPKAVQV